MSTNSGVVDLTAETETNEPHIPKKRMLPASVQPTAPIQNPQLTASYNAPRAFSNTFRPPVSSSILLPQGGGSGVRTLPASVLPVGKTVPQAASAYPRPAQYALPNARIVFSIINSKYFTARAEVGTVNPALINTFKAVPGAKFDWQLCKWLFPLSAHDVLHTALANHHKHVVEPLPRYTLAAAQLKNQRDEQNTLEGAMAGSAAESLLALKGHIPDKVLHQLAPFQRQAVQFVMGNKGRAMIADEMGLGKTRTAISAAMAYPDDWPVLIVSPSSARHHWQAELLNVLHPEFIDPKDISVVESSAHPIHKGPQHFKAKILIVSYHLVSKITDILMAIPFNVVIVDESHYMKNAQAQRTRRLLPLLRKSKRAFLLSGTPALSRPFELFTQLHAIAPAQWSNEKEYGRRYCTVSKEQKKARQLAAGTTGPKSWSEFSGASNIEELHMMLTATIMIRRLKKDILTQLPEKQRRIVQVPIEDLNKRSEMTSMLALAAEYEEKLSAHKRSRAQGAERAQEMEELAEMRARKKNVLMQLFTMSGEAKLPAILKHLEAFLDDPLSGKILVFCHHRSVMESLARYLAQRGQECIRIDGQTPSKERHSRVQHFQSGSHCRVALLAITAAGIALTLTAASTVFFAELFWTPASLLQAEDRAHRIGQTSTVKVTYFLAKGTVDELLWPLVRQKMKLLGEIVEGSKDLDFAAATEETNSEVFGGFGSSSNSNRGSSSGNLSSMVGIKRERTSDSSALIKDEELGDIASEIAKDLRSASKKGASSGSSKRGGSGRDSSETSDEEEEIENQQQQEEEDELAVVAIEEPDQLAQLYMKMHSGRTARQAAPPQSSQAPPRFQAQMQAQNYNNGSTGPPVPVSLLTPGKNGSSSSSDMISLLSPEEEARWANQQSNNGSSKIGGVSAGNNSGLSYQPGEVVDLFDDPPEEPRMPRNGDAEDWQAPYTLKNESGAAEREDIFNSMTDPYFDSPAARAAAAGGTLDSPYVAFPDTPGEQQQDEVDLTELTPSPLPAPPHATAAYTMPGQTLHMTESTIVVHEPDYASHAEAVTTTTTTSAATTSTTSSASAASAVDYASPYLSKQDLIQQAKQAWSSAIAANTPKNIRPVGKFAPSLKKADSSGSLIRRPDSTGSLNIQSISVASTTSLNTLDVATSEEPGGKKNAGAAQPEVERVDQSVGNVDDGASASIEELAESGLLV